MVRTMNVGCFAMVRARKRWQWPWRRGGGGPSARPSRGGGDSYARAWHYRGRCLGHAWVPTTKQENRRRLVSYIRRCCSNVCSVANVHVDAVDLPHLFTMWVFRSFGGHHGVPKFVWVIKPSLCTGAELGLARFPVLDWDERGSWGFARDVKSWTED